MRRLTRWASAFFESRSPTGMDWDAWSWSAVKHMCAVGVREVLILGRNAEWAPTGLTRRRGETPGTPPTSITRRLACATHDQVVASGTGTIPRQIVSCIISKPPSSMSSPSGKLVQRKRASSLQGQSQIKPADDI